MFIAAASLLRLGPAAWSTTGCSSKMPTVLQEGRLDLGLLTVCVDTTQQVLEQAHLVEGLEGLLLQMQKTATTAVSALRMAHQQALL